MPAAIANNLRQTRPVRHDHRHAARHRFERRQPEAFRDRGRDVEIGRLIERQSFSVRHPAREHDRRFKPKAFDHGRQRREDRLIACVRRSADHKLDWLIDVPLDDREGFEQERQVLARIEPGDVENVAARDSELAHLFLRGDRVLGGREGRVSGLRRHSDQLARHRQMRGDSLGRGIGRRQHETGPADRPRQRRQMQPHRR